MQRCTQHGIFGKKVNVISLKVICIVFVEGYEEVHVPHLKPKPFESNEVHCLNCYKTVLLNL